MPEKPERHLKAAARRRYIYEATSRARVEAVAGEVKSGTKAKRRKKPAAETQLDRRRVAAVDRVLCADRVGHGYVLRCVPLGEAVSRGQ